MSSDLVNSYAWDTALVFIQLYSEIQNYSIQIADNIGICGKNEDFVCNISDLRDNYTEWTTEMTTFKNGSAFTPGAKVCRGRWDSHRWAKFLS